MNDLHRHHLLDIYMKTRRNILKIPIPLAYGMRYGGWNDRVLGETRAPPIVERSLNLYTGHSTITECLLYADFYIYYRYITKNRGMKMKFPKKFLIIITAILVAATFALSGCGQGEGAAIQATDAQMAEDSIQGNIVVYHAGSLSVPFEALEKRFEELHPGVDVQRTPGGSRKIARQITELGDKVDVLCSADYTVIDTLVMPEFASWNALFAENSMVIMYSKGSKYAGEIDADNWYDVITREGVNYGHSDPDADPCGYRSVLLWQLAEKHYGKEGINRRLVGSHKAENVRPKSVELIAMLETGALDYAFEYESVAIQHAKKNPDIEYVKLPVEINLSSIEYKDFYANATIELNGKEPGEKITQKGEPIVYSLTMPSTGENSEAAVEFLKFLFDEDEGVRILKEEGQPVLDSVKVFGEENLPKGLLESM